MNQYCKHNIKYSRGKDRDLQTWENKHSPDIRSRCVWVELTF